MVVDKSTVVRWISTACLLLSLSVPPTLGNGSSCLDLGFSSNLLCSSCRELKEFGLEALEEECQRCCQMEGTVDDDYVRNNVTPEIHSIRPERVENLCNLLIASSPGPPPFGDDTSVIYILSNNAKYLLAAGTPASCC